MAFKNIKRDSLLILFVQLATWSFACGLPVKEEANLFTWDWGFTWFPPRYTTPKPFILDRITLSPDFYKPNTRSTPEPFVWFIIGGFILVMLLAALARYACQMLNNSSTVYDSSPILHPPPATTIRPVVQLPPETAIHPVVQLPPENRPGNTPFGGGLYDFPPSTTLGGIMPNYQATGNAFNTYSANDKPPDYSEVVISDFVDENKKFKEVSPKPIDTPPPTYGDQNLQRY